ncbi:MULTISPECIES: ABC-F type ribosomal protection protein CplR [Clostridium]|uniref:ABC-F type ribosomal protection protein CplR n=1 Tax=Clostridium TaxID=1485 RepID=UPI0006C0DD4A|nr:MULTISPECIES: ABC-F type ribosomal protection protein CplR [Clostridium]CUP08296.1 antibiotic resistance ABC transporter ATP-binding protein [Clostridium disporicum]
MKLVTIKNLKKYYGDRLILDIDKFEIEEKEKIGIVGENGVGKTTLLKILIGELKADEGSVYLTDSYSYISQLDEECKVCDNSKIKKIFNVPNEYEEYLSGGEKMKMRVVGALQENTSLIIADEPTSNLDSESIKKLDDMFKKYSGALLVVSHDRKFLDDVCNEIAEIEDGKLKVYKGNYSRYLGLKGEDYKKQKREYEKYVHEKERLEEVIGEKEILRDRIKKAPKGMGKSEAKTIKMGDQKGKKHIENNIRSIEKRIEHMKVVMPPKKKEKIIININEGTEVAAKNLIEVKKLKLCVQDKVLIDEINLNIKNGFKIALIGENGCGKTTLLNRILSNNSEEVKIASNVRVGYFDQRQDSLKDEKSILENIKEDSIWDESFIRINLGEFGFKRGSVNKLVGQLSGGERVKVAICKIILSNNNLLILDEPTNYLDIKTIEALENALINTNKTVLLVSHDIEFISNVCNYIIEIKDKEIHEFEGKYFDYIKNADKNKSEKKKHLDDEILVLENKVSEVLSLLSIETKEEKKDQLNKEYLELINYLRELKLRREA